MDANRDEDLFGTTYVERNGMLQRLLAPGIDVSQPQGYDVLRATSMAALREH